ncbi:hypothetical protein [Leuconostoc citreum]|uniref:hypothetical protein n=1 Tax=Leuconostoc citreum TaxID=33964 RepID=UPI0032DE8085
MIQINITIDTAIALLSLVLAIFSILYTFWSNRYSIEVDNFEYDEDREHHLVSIDFINTSSKNLKLLKIQFYNDEKLVNPINFDFEEYDEIKQQGKLDYENPYSFVNFNNVNYEKFATESILNKIDLPKTMVPNKEYGQCCYLSDNPNKVIVSTNHCVSLFSKEKSFSLTKRDN